MCLNYLRNGSCHDLQCKYSHDDSNVRYIYIPYCKVNKDSNQKFTHINNFNKIYEFLEDAIKIKNYDKAIDFLKHLLQKTENQNEYNNIKSILKQIYAKKWFDELGLGEFNDEINYDTDNDEEISIDEWILVQNNFLKEQGINYDEKDVFRCLAVFHGLDGYKNMMSNTNYNDIPFIPSDKELCSLSKTRVLAWKSFSDRHGYGDGRELYEKLKEILSNIKVENNVKYDKEKENDNSMHENNNEISNMENL